MNEVSKSIRTTEPAGEASFIWANATLVLADRVMRGTIEVEAGKIVRVSKGDNLPSGATDCGGDIVMPGLIELHTDNLERHIEPRPRVDWPMGAALIAHDRELASTGITTVFDAMRVGSIPESQARYRAYARELATALLTARAAGDFQISHYLHLRAEVCSETLLRELEEFGPEDRVGIVSLMDHTPGQRQFRDLNVMRNYVTKKRNLSDDEFATHVENLRRLRAKNGEAHERGAVEAARRIGAALASHDDTTRDQVLTSQAHGVAFGEFPTTVEAAETCRETGIAIMMGSPNLVRGGSHSGNVSARDLAEQGLLDILSSDYVPSALLYSAFLLAEIWNNLPRAVATVTSAPARVTGLTDRGRLEEGLRADIIRVSPRDGLPRLREVRSAGHRI